MSRLIPALVLTLAACGYTFVRPDAAGPVPVLSLGLVRDLTPEGDLGLRLGRALRSALAARGAPRLAAPDETAPRLEGLVGLRPDRTVGFDTHGAAFELRLHGELRLVSTGAPTPWPLWSSGDVERRAIYARGPDPAATETNRRLALETLTDELAAALLARLVQSPEIAPP